MPVIQSIHALEILDSRGNPTVSATVALSDGSSGTAHVPSGASTGKYEALELRDGDPARYRGRGVRQAIANIERRIQPALLGAPADSQAEVDRRMLHLDGTPDKSNLGANAILAVSCAFARARASSARIPLWAALRDSREPLIPLPMINILSGGLHAGGLIEIQDFLIIPHGWQTTADRLQAAVAVHAQVRELLSNKGYPVSGLADEGGWGPALERNELALEILTHALTTLGFAGKVSLAIDVAASHFYQDGCYFLKSENRRLTRGQMIGLLTGWVDRYPIVSIEDALQEDDWDGWVALTERLGSRIQLIGDDLFTTNPTRLATGIERGAANAVLVKMNQIGTLTEAMEVLRMAHAAGYGAIISARSGETEDCFLADFAVASGAGQIKVGSVARSERLAKYNRLLEIEQDAHVPTLSTTQIDGKNFEPFATFRL